MAEHLTDSVGQEMTHQAATIIDRIKDWFAHLNILPRLYEHKQLFIELGIYLSGGFVLGLIIKRYLKYILLLVLFIVTLVILEQFNLISVSVEWSKIQELLNIKQGLSFDEGMFNTYIAWIKANVWIVLAASVGFLAGLRLG